MAAVTDERSVLIDAVDHEQSRQVSNTGTADIEVSTDKAFRWGYGIRIGPGLTEPVILHVHEKLYALCGPGETSSATVDAQPGKPIADLGEFFTFDEDTSTLDIAADNITANGSPVGGSAFTHLTENDATTGPYLLRRSLIIDGGWSLGAFADTENPWAGVTQIGAAHIMQSLHAGPPNPATPVYELWADESNGSVPVFSWREDGTLCWEGVSVGPADADATGLLVNLFRAGTPDAKLTFKLRQQSQHIFSRLDVNTDGALTWWQFDDTEPAQGPDAPAAGATRFGPAVDPDGLHTHPENLLYEAGPQGGTVLLEVRSQLMASLDADRAINTLIDAGSITFTALSGERSVVVDADGDLAIEGVGKISTH